MPRVKHCGSIGCHALVTYPAKYCSKHAELDKRDYSTYNKTVRTRNATKAEQTNFYRTRQWSALRQQVLEQQHYLCQYCKANGRVKPAKVVDHIVPVEFDETSKADVDNLATICSSCHTVKSAWERNYYGTGLGGAIKSVTPVKSVKIISNLIKTN